MPTNPDDLKELRELLKLERFRRSRMRKTRFNVLLVSRLDTAISEIEEKLKEFPKSKNTFPKT